MEQAEEFQPFSMEALRESRETGVGSLELLLLFLTRSAESQCTEKEAALKASVMNYFRDMLPNFRGSSPLCSCIDALNSHGGPYIKRALDRVPGPKLQPRGHAKPDTHLWARDIRGRVLRLFPPPCHVKELVEGDHNLFNDIHDMGGDEFDNADKLLGIETESSEGRRRVQDVLAGTAAVTSVRREKYHPHKPFDDQVVECDKALWFIGGWRALASAISVEEFKDTMLPLVNAHRVTVLLWLVARVYDEANPKVKKANSGATEGPVSAAGSESVTVTGKRKDREDGEDDEGGEGARKRQESDKACGEEEEEEENFSSRTPETNRWAQSDDDE